jgi:hypothetical protein
MRRQLSAAPFRLRTPKQSTRGGWEPRTRGPTNIRSGTSPPTQAAAGTVPKSMEPIIAHHCRTGHRRHQLARAAEPRPSRPFHLVPQVVLPTGDANRGLGAGHVLAFFPMWVPKPLPTKNVGVRVVNGTAPTALLPVGGERVVTAFAMRPEFFRPSLVISSTTGA